MSDPKNQRTPQEPDEPELETETVADLEPDTQDAEKIAGGRPCDPTHVQCQPGAS